MDLIREYQRVVEIKPAKFKLRTPYDTPSSKRVIFNLNELELFYYEALGIYVSREEYDRLTAKKRGGDDCVVRVVKM